ncbi:MAG: hypothetical protein NDI63_11310 [Pseudobdellovibrio sp.]|nr:hypothetical protein [Pseudobdellovibrio sp.]
MTKNHILIKSVALGVLLMLSPFAQAADGINRSQVEYFNKLYKSQSPKCFVPEATKARIIAGLEDKCLIRTTSNNESYISGIKPACTEASVKASADSEVNAICANTAQQAEQNAVAKQAAAAQQQKDRAARVAAAQDRDQQENAAFGTMAGAVGNLMFAQKSNTKKDGSSDKKSDASTTSSASGNKETNDSKGATSTPSSTSAVAAKTPEIPKASYTYDGPDGTKVIATQNDKGDYVINQLDGNNKPIAGKETTVPPTELHSTLKGEKYGVDSSTGKLSQPETLKAMKESPEPIKSTAEKGAGDGKLEQKPDEILEKRHAASKQEDEALSAKLDAIQTKINAATGKVGPEATTICTETMGQNPECTAGTPQFVMNCVQQSLNELKADQEELKKDKIACSDTSAQAARLCSMVRSEKAQQVQQIMSVGATVLSKVTAASEACGTTSSLNKIAQGGMLAAQAACSGMKYRCDFSCKSAENSLKKMTAKIEASIQKCGASRLTTAPTAGPAIDVAFNEYKAMLEKQLTPESAVPASVAQCENHKLDMATMGLAALGFLSAAQDAQKCKEQLASGGGGGNGSSTSGMAGPQMTTAEYCSQPQNAASITCKCTANPNAEGCTGSLMNSGVALGKINTNGGLSGFASAKQNGLSSLDSTGKKATADSSEPPPGAGLSEAAREALGIGATAAGGTGATGNFGSGSESSKAVAKEEKEKPKFGFFSSLGAMLSGGKSANQAAKAAIRNYEQDQAIKRKVASDQVRAEITTASGKSNFDKISNRYRESASSFEK